MKLGIKFNLPFRLVDEDTYDFFYKKVSVKIAIKLVQNFNASEDILGMKIETSGSGKVDMPADEHGVVNYTKITMEIEDHTDCNIGCLSDTLGFNLDLAIKITCMQMLNRLVEVIRNSTNKFWIRFVTLRDIMNFQIFDISQTPNMAIVSMSPGHGYGFPNFRIIEQENVKDVVKEILANQSEMDTWKNLFLDSIDYFTKDRYNDAVIIANVSLESFIANHLYNKLNGTIPDNKEENRLRILKLPKSLHKIMRKHFPTIDGRKLEDNEDLWNKFDNIRRYNRPDAMHSFTKKIDQKTAYETIQDIKTIMKWINPDINLG